MSSGCWGRFVVAAEPSSAVRQAEQTLVVLMVVGLAQKVVIEGTSETLAWHLEVLVVEGASDPFVAALVVVVSDANVEAVEGCGVLVLKLDGLRLSIEASSLVAGPCEEAFVPGFPC